MAEKHPLRLADEPLPYELLKDPSLRDRIMGLVEKQAEHRQRMDQSRVLTERLGIACGFLIALLGIGAAIYFAAAGHPWPGAFFGSVDIAGLVGVFVYGTRTARHQALEKPRGADGTKQ